MRGALIALYALLLNFSLYSIARPLYSCTPILPYTHVFLNSTNHNGTLLTVSGLVRALLFLYFYFILFCFYWYCLLVPLLCTPYLHPTGIVTPLSNSKCFLNFDAPFT